MKCDLLKIRKTSTQHRAGGGGVFWLKSDYSPQPQRLSLDFLESEDLEDLPEEDLEAALADLLSLELFSLFISLLLVMFKLKLST